MIYAIKSSGNQDEYALRETSPKSQYEYPVANKDIHKDVYVDDCLSGATKKEKVMQLADKIQIVLSRGVFSLKSFTFSGDPTLKSLSSNNKSINVAGIKWYPQDDQLLLDITELSLNKKQRGKKSQFLEKNKIPKLLTSHQNHSGDSNNEMWSPWIRYQKARLGW